MHLTMAIVLTDLFDDRYTDIFVFTVDHSLFARERSAPPQRVWNSAVIPLASLMPQAGMWP